MRETKFRAWDKENKKWLDGADFLISSNGTVLLYDLQFGSKYGNLTGKWREDEDDRIEIVRFTGLKDKNGKEIYEGDVVRYNYQLKSKIFPSIDLFGEVVFDIRTFDTGYAMSRHVGFILRGVDHGEYWYTDIPGIEDVEVIGNIYENPELLKTK